MLLDIIKFHMQSISIVHSAIPVHIPAPIN